MGHHEFHHDVERRAYRPIYREECALGVLDANRLAGPDAGLLRGERQSAKRIASAGLVIAA
jgi:hypothetical protein